MGKGRKSLVKKRTECHRPKLLAPPPSLMETTKGTSKSTAEGRLKVTEAPSDRQDKIPKNPEFLIDKIKAAPRTTSSTVSENKQKEVKQYQLKQEVRSQEKKGMGEDLPCILELVQEELWRTGFQELLTGLQNAKGALEAKLWREERESFARTGTKVVKEEGKDMTSDHREVRPGRTKIKQNEGPRDSDVDPTARGRGKEPSGYPETDRQTSRQRAEQQEITKEKDKEKHLTRSRE